ncbi:MAG: hypothetical protein J2O49_11485, partial [Sciscionella sp.]|nr:hypothetical protein [Sciscionella sp.]
MSANVRSAWVGVALVVLGAGLWLVSRLVAGTEPHVYAAGPPPESVQLVHGHTYTLAIRGGVLAAQNLGVAPSTLRCSVSSPQIGVRPLTVRPEASDTKAVNQIATFTAPVSGRVHVSCAGLTDVFVDDAADAPADHAGLALVLATIALTVGTPLALSGLRSFRLGR